MVKFLICFKFDCFFYEKKRILPKKTVKSNFFYRNYLEEERESKWEYLSEKGKEKRNSLEIYDD